MQANKIGTKIIAGLMCVMPATLTSCGKSGDVKCVNEMSKFCSEIRNFTFDKLGIAQKDTFDLSETNAKQIIAKVKYETAFHEKTAAFVKKYFDKDDAESLLRESNSFEKDKRLVSIIKLNNKRKNEKLSTYAISEILNTDSKEQYQMNLKLINARDAKNNLYYCSDLHDIIYLLNASSRFQKREIAAALFKRKVSADEIKNVLIASGGFDGQVEMERSSIALKMLSAKNKNGSYKYAPQQIVDSIHHNSNLNIYL
jgi:hypothetical protein